MDRDKARKLLDELEGVAIEFNEYACTEYFKEYNRLREQVLDIMEMSDA